MNHFPRFKKGLVSWGGWGGGGSGVPRPDLKKMTVVLPKRFIDSFLFSGEGVVF